MNDCAPPKVSRPVLRWHGGKWMLAPWIIAHLPPHRIYVEPFGGAASVLLRKPRSYAEIYNDLDGDVVNLFQVLRDPQAAALLIQQLELTPFARDEFEGAYLRSDDPVAEARSLIIRSFMGFGSDGFNREVRTGFRANANKAGSTPAHDWGTYPDALRAIVDRLRPRGESGGVVIENRPAIQIMQTHDGAGTLHYVDPPYLPETRSQKTRRSGMRYHAYRHEMTMDDHAELLAFLPGLQGGGSAVGVSVAPIRSRPKHLAQGRARGPGRWGAASRRSPMDQRQSLGRAQPSAARGFHVR